MDFKRPLWMNLSSVLQHHKYPLGAKQAHVFYNSIVIYKAQGCRKRERQKAHKSLKSGRSAFARKAMSWRKMKWDVLLNIEKGPESFRSRSHVFRTSTREAMYSLLKHNVAYCSSTLRHYPKNSWKGSWLEYQALENVSWVLPRTQVWGKVSKLLLKWSHASKRLRCLSALGTECQGVLGFEER